MDAIIKELASAYIFPGVIFIVMFGLGLALNLGMIWDVLRRPRATIIGLLGQMVFLPLAAFVLAYLGLWSSLIALGLIVIAVCPGGSTSNVIVFAIRGDIALSVSLTAISSVLTLFSIPFLLGLALQYWGAETHAIVMPAGQVMKNLALMTALPIALGMITQRQAPAFAARMIEPMRKLSLVLLLLIIALSIYNARSYISAQIVQIALASTILVVTVIGGGFLMARFAGLTLSQQLVIAIEVGVQNTPLAIYLGSSLLKIPELSIIAICYGLINYALIGILIFMVRRTGLDRTFAADALAKDRELSGPPP